MTLLPAISVADSPRPNILLILADDLGYADVGFQGSTDILTPELDQLAKQGTTFSSAYVVHPFCGPSRMALLSGRYPYEFGAPFNLPDHSTRRYTDQGITTEETLISTVLKDAGYRTGIMGKWHLGQQA
ncbi:MAG TPA: sulfatase-like hydrolase/transferase, partial [Pirellulaceae bacterium]|nr:sulfatase-like hydrolase/transferase [Pirellulaceae bacterium]